MKSNNPTAVILLPAAMLALFGAQLCSAQAPPSPAAPGPAQPTGLAGDIIAARQKNDALVRQYSWECRTDVLVDSVSKDLRIEQMNYGPGGQLQRTLINDQSAPLPMGFFAARIAEEVRGQVHQALMGLRGLLEQYTLPSSGKIVNFISTGTISAPDTNGVLQITGSSVVVPGDTLSMWVDVKTRQPRRMKIMTYYQGYQVTATATFNTLAATGLNYMAYGQMDVPATGMTVQVQNFDYTKQNF